MPTFSYEAINDNGSTVTGTVDADSLEAAQQRIVDRGLLPSKVRRAGKGAKAKASSGGFMARFGSVKPQDIILFTKQFRTMLNAGIAVVQALEVLETQSENPKLKAIIVAIAQDVKGGASLYRAFKRHQDVFSPLYCNMIRAGEVSGTLIDVLDRLIYIVDHEFKVKKDIKSALTYPIIVIVALVIAFVILIMFVFPNFVSMFEKQNIELPLPTRICIGINTLMSAYWPIILGGVVGLAVGLYLWRKTPQGRLAIDTAFLHLPILGKVFVKAAMSRFASIFAILQSSGVTVLDSVDILVGTIGNEAVAYQFRAIKEKLEQGRGLSGPLRQAKYFPSMMITMIAIGEESGQLEEMLREAAAHYDYEVEYSVSKMSELIGPILTAGLAGVVGFFAFAIFLPLMDLMQNAMGGL